MRSISPTAVPLCPVCGSVCSEPPIFRYSIDQSAAHFCSRARNADRHERLWNCIHRLWDGGDCVILGCRECTFSFAFPFVGGDEEYYDILHEQQGYVAWRWDYDVAVAEAARSGSRGRIIDIGAGTGAFLIALDDSWEKYATEGGESTRKQMESKGIQVYRDLKELVAKESGTFEVVTMFQLLEHVSDFRPLLEQCRALLRPEGKLVITVPDGEAMLRQERLTGCPDMPPFHVNKWSPKSLSKVLQQVGFQPGAHIPAPSQWREIPSMMHLRVIADASKPGSITSQVYRIQRKSLRIPLLAALGIPALVRLLPNIRQLLLPGAFAMVASRA